MTSSIAQRVAQATTGRDRVLDTVKTAALLTVVVGHSLAWHVGDDGTAVNVLEEVPSLTVVTWLFQVLPLFFAAGAVANAASLGRGSTRDFLRRRTRRLTTPVVLYAGLWTALLSIVALVVLLLTGEQNSTLTGAGRFLAQLLWFAGVYTLVVAAAPLTVRWQARPVLTLVIWATAAAGVDAARIAGAPSAIGWVNFILVWGWLHQLGYQIPALRQANRAVVAAAGVASIAAATALTKIGPYSSSLVTVSGDEQLSNLAPPSMVLLLYGAGQVLLLVACWPWLAALLRSDRLWAAVAIVAARAMGIYLWHIPLVGVAAAVALAVGWQVAPLSAAWWSVHLLVVALVVPGAWWLAGQAERAQRRLDRVPRRFAVPVGVAAVGAAVTIILISTTGFATLAGEGLFGLPASAPVNLLLLVLWWQAVAAPSPEAP